MHMLAKFVLAASAFVPLPILAATVPAAVPAVQAAPQAGQTRVAQTDIEKKDPVICERVGEIGSRLRVKKICKSKSEWEEQRRSDRSNIERSQVQRGLDPAG